MHKLFFGLVLLVMACNDQPAATTTTVKKEEGAAKEPAKRRVEILDPEANQFFDSTTAIDIVGSGFTWTEGPLYVKDGDYFLFSDVVRNRIYKWKEGDSVRLYLEPSGYLGTQQGKKEPGSNALALNNKGELVLCQQGERRMAKMKAPLNAPKPQFEVLVDRYEGKRFNSPNDAVFASNGDLYFTDPPYGLDKGMQDATKEIQFQGVYRLTPKGHLDLLTKDLRYPNGVAFTPDGKYLLVASSDGDNPVWMKYELNGKGLIKSQSVFYDIRNYGGNVKGGPDGMKFNSKGYLFSSGPGGIWVFNPQAKPIARVYTGEATSNCAFSADEKTLFLTCDDYVMRMKLK